MWVKIIITFGIWILFVSALPEHANPLHIKRQVASLKKELHTADDREKGPLLLDLALLYLKDQNLEEALNVYLSALDYAPKKEKLEPSVKELTLYEQLLPVYLDSHINGDINKTALLIEREVSVVLDKNPNFSYLQFLLAASKANLGNYGEFFDKFYKSYQYYPNSFMALRTKAVLYSILHDRSKTAFMKTQCRKYVFSYAYSSWKMEPSDIELCKMLVRFSPEEKKSEILKELLEGLLKEETKVSRSDIAFFVRNAVDVDQKFLAQRFLDKAREWYSYSQAIETAQNYIDRH